MEWRLSLHLGVVAIEKGALVYASTKVTNFTLITLMQWDIENIVTIAMKHLEINQTSVENNLQGVGMPLNI